MENTSNIKIPKFLKEKIEETVTLIIEPGIKRDVLYKMIETVFLSGVSEGIDRINKIIDDVKTNG